MMGVIVSLYVLVMMDSAFSGICAASGRNAVLNKRAYYLRSMWDGAMWLESSCCCWPFGFLRIENEPPRSSSPLVDE